LHTEKLYSPLEFYLHDPVEKASSGDPGDINGTYGLYDTRYRIAGIEATEFMDAIELAVLRDRSTMDRVRGMAEYLPDELQGKVLSMFLSIEFHGNDLYCVTTMEVQEALTPNEVKLLKDEWSGQLSDGWGEGFEQREIKVGDEELYIVPWTSGGGFFIDTEREFMARLGIEPPAHERAEVSEIPTQAANYHEPAEQPQPLNEVKLYSPVFVDLWEYDEYGSYPVHSEPLDQSAAALYANEISAAIIKERLPEESERGLMEYYREGDSVDEKVHSMHVDVEVHNGKLWAVSTLEVTEPLTEGELTTLRNYITGQFADGFGEGFEQREIKIDGGELNVHLWSIGDKFFIDTQEQFVQRLTGHFRAGVISEPAPEVSTLTPLTPAQAALNEPDIFDCADTAALRDKLIDRLDQNFSDYFDSLRRLDGENLTGKTLEIALMSEAHFHLTELHNFHMSELEYLLQFKNPLEVIANAFEDEGFDDHRSTAMWKVFDRQDALQGDYELADAPRKGYFIAVTDDSSDFYIPDVLHIQRDDSLAIYPDDEAAALAAERDGIKLIYGMPFVPDGVYIDTPENRSIIANHFEQHRLSLPANPDVTQDLRNRLDENLADYKKAMLNLSDIDIFNEAEEIAEVKQSYEYFRNEHAFTTGQVEFLLKLQNPLELMSDRWGDGIGGVKDIVKAIFSEPERTLRSGSYALASDDSVSLPTVAVPGKAHKSVDTKSVGAGEKPSVLEQIRQAKQEARERPAMPNTSVKDAPIKKKSDPEL